MLQHQRRSRILELVKERGACTVDELREELGISGITLYRDLKKLDQDNLICRVHGGVTLREPDAVEWRFSERIRVNAAAKEAIGCAVAAEVREGARIFMDASSSVYLFARHLSARGLARLTVVTTSPGVPLLFEAAPQIRTISTGGELHPILNTYGGPIAMRVIGEMNFDTAYVSCAGFDLAHGATTDAPLLVELLREVASRSREVVMLADGSKLSRLAMMTSLRMHEITRIVTDAGAPVEAIRRIRDAGLDVTVVGPGPANAAFEGANGGGGRPVNVV